MLNEFLNVFLEIPNLVMVMVDFFVSLIKMVPKLLTVFFYILDPVGLLNDLMFGMTEGVTLVFESILDIIFGSMRKVKKRGSNDSTTGDKKCISGSVVDTIILVLCPPLYVVLKEGFIKGFFPTVICFVLTYLYYLPGLVYAMLYYI